ncbi:MAG TPA: hypothetical protein VFB20_12225 [Burkholderiales bacterium]|nr:hypothetical protein [Burkholderiales bacterium]
MATSRYRDTYHPHVRKVDNSRVEMTLQMTTEGMIMLGKVSEGATTWLRSISCACRRTGHS